MIIHKIAMALAQELRELYPLDEIHAVPSFYYEHGKSAVSIPIHGDPKPTSYSLAAVRDKIALWTMNIGDGTLSVTINEDSPEVKIFDKIDGLPDVSFQIAMSKKPNTTRFILAEPNCIEKALAKIKEYYPVPERINQNKNPATINQENDRESGS